MTTTYKKLASYFLQRDLTTTVPGGGYYYGNGGSETTVLEDFNSSFNSIKTELAFNPNAGEDVLSIALQPDGKILIGGYFLTIGGVTRNHIARLNSDGTLDTTFNPDASHHVLSIAVQPDGKILIGGSFSTIDGTTRNRIARLNSDGTLDTSFNPNANSDVVSIALQPDGKILIGGYFTTIDGTTRNSIARLNSDGTLDTSFNPNANSDVDSIALQPDGKILIGGHFTTIDGTTRNRIARLNSDGTLDTSFNPNADHTSPNPNFNIAVFSIALQPDGKILIGGSFTTIDGTTRNRIARLNSDGTLDTSFNPNADHTSPNPNSNSIVFSIALQPDGKILIVGRFTTIDGVTRKRIARLNSDGTLDTSFNTRANSIVFSIALQPDGKILIGGNFSTIGGTTRNKIARLKEVVNNAPYRLAYKVPENTQVIVKNIFATNHNDFPVFHDIAILPEADVQEGISEKHYYVWDNLIDDNEYEVIESGITLSAGDEIYVYSSTDEDISYNIFGVEITEQV